MSRFRNLVKVLVRPVVATAAASVALVLSFSRVHLALSAVTYLLRLLSLIALYLNTGPALIYLSCLWLYLIRMRAKRAYDSNGSDLTVRQESRKNNMLAGVLTIVSRSIWKLQVLKTR